MTSLARVFREKRRLLVPLAVLAVLNLAALLLIVYPLSRRVAGTERRAAEAKTQLTAATAQYAATQNTLEGRGRADEQLARFYSEVLPTNQAAARRVTYLKLAEIAREANLLYDSRSFSVETAKDKEGILTRLDMKIVLNGDYRDIRRFIHTLETSPEFIVIQDVSLAKASDPKEPLALTVLVATYYRTADER